MKTTSLTTTNGTQLSNDLGSSLTLLLNVFVSSQDINPNSQGTYKRTFRQFLLWTLTTGKDFDELKGSDIIEYKHHLTEIGLSTSSQNAYLIPVRRFYEWAESEKLYPNIAKGIKGTKKKREVGHMYLRDEESSLLLDWAKSTTTRRRKSRKEGGIIDRPTSEEIKVRDFAILNLMLRNGLRTIEVIRMDVSDIVDAETIQTQNGTNYVVKIWGKGRTSKDQEIVMTEKTYRPIREYLDTFRKCAKLNEPLFTSTSRQNVGNRLTTRTISSICKEGLQGIGKDGRRYTAHSLRTTTACALLEHGCNVFDAQQVLRHSNPATTQIYTHLKEAELRRINAPEMALDLAF